MNVNGLAKHYDKLTAWERLPLLLAALNRGDDAETERLTNSAPTRPANVPHYYGLWEGLTLLSVVHLLQQLSRVCRLGYATALQAAGRVEEEEALRLSRMLAFQFVLDADAWQLLSAELQLDPEAILRHLPGCDLVRGMEEAARKMALTPEEALAYLRSGWEASETAAGKAAAARREYRLDTAADLAREMREYLAGCAKQWL
jgi:hypothetical protein